jgi:hypothetical protein
MINDNNNNENSNDSISIGMESLIKSNFTTKHINNNESKRSNEQMVLEEIDVDIDELVNTDEPSVSIVYFPSSHAKSMSNIFDDISR